MQQLIYVLPALLCPISMGLMMWFMMRPGHKQHTDAGTGTAELELTRLRAQIEELRASQSHPGSTSGEWRVERSPR